MEGSKSFSPSKSLKGIGMMLILVGLIMAIYNLAIDPSPDNFGFTFSGIFVSFVGLMIFLISGGLERIFGLAKKDERQIHAPIKVILVILAIVASFLIGVYIVASQIHFM